MHRVFPTLWVIFLPVFFTACSNTNSGTTEPLQDGFAECSGNFGDFDVYLTVSSNAGVYQMNIIPVNVPQTNVEGTIAIANSNPSEEILLNEVDIVQNQTINVGTITDAQLQNYNILAITPYSAAVDYLSASSSGDTICYVPQPGSNSNQAH
jgi:hypothetical protein